MQSNGIEIFTILQLIVGAPGETFNEFTNLKGLLKRISGYNWY